MAGFANFPRSHFAHCHQSTLTLYPAAKKAGLVPADPIYERVMAALELMMLAVIAALLLLTSRPGLAGRILSALFG